MCQWPLCQMTHLGVSNGDVQGLNLPLSLKMYPKEFFDRQNFFFLIGTKYFFS